MQSLQVHIPAGIDTGKSVRLRGKGNPGIGGGEAGDLFLKVTAVSYTHLDVYKRQPFWSIDPDAANFIGSRNHNTIS